MNTAAQALFGTLCWPLLSSLCWAQTPNAEPLKIYVNAFGFSTQWQPQDPEAKLPISYSLDVPFSNSLDNIKMAHTLYLDVSKGLWGLYFDQQYIKATVDDQLYGIDFQLKAKMDRRSLGTYVNVVGDNAHLGPAKTILAPTIGLHQTKVGIDLSADFMGQTHTLSRTASWHEPYLGVRFAHEFNRHWVLYGQANVGTRRSKEYLSYIAYRDELFNRPMNVRLGYRILNQKHIKDDFTWDVNEKSLMLGFSVQLR